MKIKLISVSENKFPTCGIFVEGLNLKSWITSLEDLKIDLQSVEIYALPSKNVNVNWGCLVLEKKTKFPKTLGRFEAALSIAEQLIIPGNSTIFPNLSQNDLTRLLNSDRYVMHNDFGLFKLEDPIDLEQHLSLQIGKQLNIIAPIAHQSLSNEIKCFRIEARPKEEIKKEMEDSLKPKREKIKNKPLSLIEKIRLKAYQQVLKIDKDKNGNNIISSLEKKNFTPLSKLISKMGVNNIDKIKEDFEDLTERNKREVDKLLDMLKKNPEDALRYAIPLDEGGINRGGTSGTFKMGDRNNNFSLFGRLGAFGGSTNNGGGSIDLGQEYYRLQNQYRITAAELSKKGNYEKAAFIYMKLLKDYQSAGKVLRNGKEFEQAALVYHTYAKDDLKAAECYEEGKIYDKAIELFEKKEKFEKVGDLYTLLGNRNSANRSYQKVIDKCLRGSKYLKASVISKNKMNDISQAQKILISGWDSKIDQFNCLNNYFNNIGEPDKIWTAIENIKANKVDLNNESIFLKVLKHEFQKENEIQTNIQNLAYDMISKMLNKGSISSNELLAFNPNDRRLAADAIRYQVGKKKRM